MIKANRSSGGWVTFWRIVDVLVKILITAFACSRLHAQSRVVWESFESSAKSGADASTSIVSILGQPFFGNGSAGNISLSTGFGAFVVGTGKTTSVAPSKSGIPLTYTLSQNYPNPFNPSTTLEFGLPEPGKVSIVVYDIIGRAAATLVEGDLEAGYHTVRFSAQTLASGVYFYRIVAAGKGGASFVETKKMMLLK